MTRRCVLPESLRLAARGRAEGIRVGFDPAAFSWLEPVGLEARTGPAVRVSDEGIRVNRAAAELMAGGTVPARAWLAVGVAPKALALSLAGESQGYPARADRGGLRVHSVRLARELERQGWSAGRAYRLEFDPKSGLLVALR